MSLGGARGAIDAFVDLITGTGSAKGHLQESALAQFQVGRADTQLRAARAVLFETLRQVWEEMARTGPLITRQHLPLRVASAYAAFVSAQVVEALWYALGSSSIFASDPLERRIRDAHAAAQRFNAAIYQDARRILLERATS